jgi:hypothetical protein
LSRVYTNPQHYADIANAIRIKRGSEEQYAPAEMAEAILAIETEPVIEPLIATQNGTYTAPEGVDGYSPVNVSVQAGERNADIHWYSPKICEGDPQVLIHSDCEMKEEIAGTDYTVSENVLSLSQTDTLNILLMLDKDNISPGDKVEFIGNLTIYQYQNGTADPLSTTVMPLTIDDVYEPFEMPSYRARNVLPRMRVIRNNVKMDEGSDTVTFTKQFPGVGIGSAATGTVSMNANSYMTVSGLQINVNQRDASVYYVWSEEGISGDYEFMKVRWKGSSHYNIAVDQEWEIVLLTNGDVILRLITKGSYTGTFTFKGTAYQVSTEQTVCFYRKDFFGTAWDYFIEPYSVEHHHPESEQLYARVNFSDYVKTVNEGSTHVNNVAYDDNAYNFNFDPSFTWHGKSYATVSGNSWIGIGSGSEEIKAHRRDSKMWYFYVLYTVLKDMDEMRAMRMSWRGASHHNTSIDRWWTLWLFENGDAMIYISAVGSNTGECSFYGQPYTGSNDSCISFYYDPDAGNYDIKYEQYTLEHHIG